MTASKLVIEPSAPEDSSISVDQAAASTQPEEDVDETFESFLKNGNIEVSIRAYEKRGEGINAYLVYKIETRVCFFILRFLSCIPYCSKIKGSKIRVILGTS